MPRRLKVFRTTIGFHDAYVAAPSRKAALAAWGATKDLFAMEAAEEVTDTELMEEPLAHPSQVIQKVRGSLEQQLDALKATFAAQSEKPRNESTRCQNRAERRWTRLRRRWSSSNSRGRTGSRNYASARPVLRRNVRTLSAR